MFTGEQLAGGGWVEVAGERVTAWGWGTPPSPPDVVIDGLLAPGYVDVHSHGGGGANFGANRADVETVLAAHLGHGTTTMIASLVTGRIDDLEVAVRSLADLADEGLVAGTHLEGPWLAREYKGAHPEDLLVDPALADVARLIEAGRGTVKMVTIAPERAGALDAIAYLAGQGVVAAVGHTAADYDTARAAIARGARGTTHLFNAMPPLLHRAPGPVLAQWADPRVWVELVCDGIHLHPDLVAHVMATKPDRCVLVTDAMAAAAFADGDYILGELPVEVRDGIAHIAGTNTIAGSTLTLDKAVRTAVGAGVPVELALTAATSHPADYLGLTGVGRIAEGTWADVIALDDGLNVTRVMRRGTWV
jgi:N-acetylglucosamine-6-phosphate deacetylase